MFCIVNYRCGGHAITEGNSWVRPRPGGRHAGELRSQVAVAGSALSGVVSRHLCRFQLWQQLDGKCVREAGGSLRRVGGLHCDQPGGDMARNALPPRLHTKPRSALGADRRQECQASSCTGNCEPRSILRSGKGA